MGWVLAEEYMKIESQISGAFTGWHGNALFKLVNGQFWLQAEYKYKYRYKYRPRAVITRSGGGYQLEVEGMDSTVLVRQVNAIESNIDGEFTGWSGNTEFRLQNGEIWQQAAYAYWYHYAYNPEVIIYESSGGYVICLPDDPSTNVGVRRIR